IRTDAAHELGDHHGLAGTRRHLDQGVAAPLLPVGVDRLDGFVLVVTKLDHGAPSEARRSRALPAMLCGVPSSARPTDDRISSTETPCGNEMLISSATSRARLAASFASLAGSMNISAARPSSKNPIVAVMG